MLSTKKRIAKRKRNAIRVKVAVPHLVRNWLEQNFKVNDVATIKKTKLYEEYLEFCEENNLTPKQNNIFGRMLSQTFPSVYTRRIGPKGHQVCHYAGIQHHKSTTQSPTTDSKTNVADFRFPISFQSTNTLATAVIKQEQTTHLTFMDTSTTTTTTTTTIDSIPSQPPQIHDSPNNTDAYQFVFNVMKEEIHTTWSIAEAEDEEERMDEEMDLQDLLASLRENTPPAMEDSPQLLAASLSFLELDAWGDETSQDSSDLSSLLTPPTSPPPQQMGIDWDPCADFLL